MSPRGGLDALEKRKIMFLYRQCTCTDVRWDTHTHRHKHKQTVSLLQQHLSTNTWPAPAQPKVCILASLHRSTPRQPDRHTSWGSSACRRPRNKHKEAVTRNPTNKLILKLTFAHKTLCNRFFVIINAFKWLDAI